MTLFPAHAGVILSQRSVENWEGAFPRTRGGDPLTRRVMGLI